jgi:glucose/arabinose dehydrogenase
VRRVRLDGERVLGEEALFSEIGERLRDIKTGPGGALYILTDQPQGRVLKITASD